MGFDYPRVQQGPASISTPRGDVVLPVYHDIDVLLLFPSIYFVEKRKKTQGVEGFLSNGSVVYTGEFLVLELNEEAPILRLRVGIAGREILPFPVLKAYVIGHFVVVDDSFCLIPQ